MPYSKVAVKHVESAAVALGLVRIPTMEAKAYEVLTCSARNVQSACIILVLVPGVSTEWC